MNVIDTSPNFILFQVTPLDISHLQFEDSGYHFTWRKVTTTVHNIIVGKLWIDNHGEMTIVNHVTEDKCHLKFVPYSYFSRDAPRKVRFFVPMFVPMPNFYLLRLPV